MELTANKRKLTGPVIKTSEDGGVLKIYVLGNANSLAAQQKLVNMVNSNLLNNTHDKVILDLTRCLLVLTSIIGHFISWNRQLQDRGKELILVNPPELINEMIRVLKLGPQIAVMETRS
jgi:anti-anti-sigma regulatory factor